MLDKLLRVLGVVVACLVGVGSCSSAVTASSASYSSSVLGTAFLLILIWLFISWLDS